MRVRSARGSTAVGSSNTRAEVSPAVALSQRFDVSAVELASGFAVAQGATAVQVPQSPALAVTPSASGAAVAEQAPGVALSQRFSARAAEQTPALSVVSVTFDLDHNSGGTATNVNSSPNVWTNTSNGSGLHNGSSATMAGSLTEAKDAVMRLAYGDFTDKGDLAISSVLLRFYVASAGTVANNGSMQLLYRVDGSIALAGATSLESWTNNVDALTSPREHDITAAVAGDWSKLDALVTFVRARTDAGESLVNYSVDAVELVVAASVTDTL